MRFGMISRGRRRAKLLFMTSGNLILAASFLWALFFGFWKFIIFLAIFILIIRPTAEVIIRKISRKLYEKYDKALTEVLEVPPWFITSGYPEYFPGHSDSKKTVNDFLKKYGIKKHIDRNELKEWMKNQKNKNDKII